MNKAKYFRIKKKTSRNGLSLYVVESADTFIDLIFGNWREYTKSNYTLEDGISQIKIISEYKIDKEKIIYKETIK